MKKIFFDTEFTGLVKETDLLSIGLISDCGRTFYAEISDFRENLLDEWVKENVMTNMRFQTEYSSKPTLDTEHHAMKCMKQEVKTFLTPWLAQFDQKIEMWSDCLAWDWVLFCDIWGGAMQLPDFISYIPMDICTMFRMHGLDPDIGREEFSGMAGKKHNALHDAKVVRACYMVMTTAEFLQGEERIREISPGPGRVLWLPDPVNGM